MANRKWMVGLTLALCLGLWVGAGVARADEGASGDSPGAFTAPAGEGSAQPPDLSHKRNRRRHGKGHGRAGAANKAKRAFRKRFDLNGDGKLDKTERANMKAARERLRTDPEMKRLREQLKQALAKMRELRGVRGKGKAKGPRQKRTEEEKAALKAAREAVKAARQALSQRREALLAEFIGGLKK